MDYLYNPESFNKSDFEYFTKIAKSKKDKINYLLNLKGLYENRKKYNTEERCIYIDVASYRNFADYEFNGIKTVPIKNVQHLYDIDKLKLNRLLIVTGRDIKLQFEEEI